jgi:hypothetical protein
VLKAIRRGDYAQHWTDDEKDRCRPSTNPSQAHAESSLSVSHQIINSVRKSCLQVCVTIDKTPFRSSMAPVIERAPGYSSLSSLCTWQVLGLGPRYHSARLQWRMHHDFAERRRIWIEISRLEPHPGLPLRCLFYHGQYRVSRIVCRMGQRVPASVAPRALADGIARNRPVITGCGTGRGL